jgi:RNA polymerase sigma-70 factor (ECF subfamily)
MNLQKERSKDETELSQLMKQTQDGDGSAYHVLLLRLEAMLQSFVRNYIRDDAYEDVIQEVILAIHSKRHTFNSEQLFLPWFYAIARYKVIDWIRAKGRAQVLISVDPDDLASAESNELSMDVLESMLDKLPEKQRDVIRVVKFDGLSIRDAAEKLNISESDIKVTIHRAIKNLKKIFEGEIR